MTPAEPDNLAVDLSAYLDGALEPDRAREIEEILRESPAARETLEQLRQVSTSLGALPRLRAPEDLSVAFGGSRPRPVTGAGWAVRRPGLIRLAARISASAAMIFLGLVAGWALFSPPAETQPDNQPPACVRNAPDRPTARRLASPDAGMSSADSKTADEVAEARVVDTADTGQSGEAVPLALGGPAAPHLDATAAAPPALEHGEPVAARPAEVPAAALPSTRQPTPPASVDAEPAIVHVVVSPRDARTYAAVLEEVASWRPASARERANGAVGSNQTREITLHVPPDRVGVVLADLNQRAPQQVRATMQLGPREFAQGGSLMLQAESFSPPSPAAAPADRVSNPLGIVRRQPRTGKHVARGGRAPAAGATIEPPPERKPETRKRKKGYEEGLASPAARSKASDGNTCGGAPRRLPHTGYGTGRRGAVSAPPAPRPRQSRREPADWLERLTQPWADVYESLLGVVFRTAQPGRSHSQPALAPIPVRITILPPEQPLSQPATRQPPRQQP